MSNFCIGPRCRCVIAAALCLLPVLALAADEWLVPTADLRFELQITSNPSEPRAGILAVIPDGGLLPKPMPDALVFDAEGKKLASDCVWYNAREGFGIVFEPPAQGRSVFVYVRGGARVNVAGGASTFTPSLLLYTVPNEESLQLAEALATEYPPGKQARMGLVPMIGQRANPFGHSDHWTAYYTGYLKVADAGETYICTISDKGSRCLVDGKVVADWPGDHTIEGGRKGEHGTSVQLSAGLHRVQYFYYAKGGQPVAQLCWRTPKDKGGLPRTVNAADFVHSGAATIAHVAGRTGAAAALFTAECQSYIWLTDKPMNLFRFKVPRAADYPAETKYTWDLPGGLQLHEKEFLWLMEGNDSHDVTLTVASPGGVSKATRPVYFDFVPYRASGNSWSDRRIFREALLARARSAPSNSRPAANWSEDLWGTLLATVDPFEGKELLELLVEKSYQDLQALQPENRWYLEDVYFDLIADDKERVLKWLDTRVKTERDNRRIAYWQLRRVEYYLYDLDDAKTAKELVGGLHDLALAGGAETAARWLVRRGDIERLTGNYDAAREFYSAAQDSYQRTRKLTGAASGPAGAQATADAFNRSIEDLKKRMSGERTVGPKGKPKDALPGAVNDWRAEAVRATSYYEMVHSLIAQRYLYEARKVMEIWEVEFPLSKLTGDWPLAEAEFLMAAGNEKRAVRVLQAYRKSVEISNFLPDAMQLELRCLVNLKRFDEVKALAADINKRFPNLPVAQAANDWMKTIEQGPSTTKRLRRPDDMEKEKENAP